MGKAEQEFEALRRKVPGYVFGDLSRGWVLGLIDRLERAEFVRDVCYQAIEGMPCSVDELVGSYDFDARERRLWGLLPCPGVNLAEPGQACEEWYEAEELTTYRENWSCSSTDCSESWARKRARKEAADADGTEPGELAAGAGQVALGDPLVVRVGSDQRGGWLGSE